ncbi:PadR family transcriptional regulator [Salisediminibacterium beveridgei]|uniref:Transcriptional regulator, PadR family n=1 Tax=Salisediminibacterium beveridgei TaxID=632773 RepID=A0A1D7R074_9BACI|nr:PadR family transcriptional regulator [Salisediminibacterium beveridgei]AOM84666.1 Transcriptional regulator, PadR family [Salisediminibacterium beveridgei]
MIETMMNESKWHMQISKGVLEVAIMKLVQHKERYGYEITGMIQQGGTLIIANGSIYPILKRLEEQEWIESRQIEHNGRLRKYYKLTKAGQIQLKVREQYLEELNQLLFSLEQEEADNHDHR